MKTVISLFLALALCLSLCACGAGNVENHSAVSKENTNTKKQQEDIPSDDLLQKDLESALYIKNEYATVVDYETIKSLTGDGSYEITLSVKAETEYADWTYEVDMDYRKYDQGWMVDDISWVSGNYEQVRIPDAKTMQSYAKEYLVSREDFYEDYFLSVENGTVNLESDSTADSNMLVYTWDAVEEYSFYDTLYNVTTWWEYNAEIDNWEVLPDNTAGSLGYCVYASVSQVPKENLDFTGSWYARHNTGEIIQGIYYIEFVFSNFSWNEFDVKIPGSIDTPEHFTIASYNPFTNDVYDLLYVNEDGEYIGFSIQDYSGVLIHYINKALTLEKGILVDKEFLQYS